MHAAVAEKLFRIGNDQIAFYGKNVRFLQGGLYAEVIEKTGIWLKKYWEGKNKDKNTQIGSSCLLLILLFWWLFSHYPPGLKSKRGIIRQGGVRSQTLWTWYLKFHKTYDDGTWWMWEWPHPKELIKLCKLAMFKI